MLKAWKVILSSMALLLAASSWIPPEAAADRVINVRTDYHGGGYRHYPRDYYRPYPRPYYRPYSRPYPYRPYYPRYYYRFSPYPYYYFPVPPPPPYPFYPGW